MIFNQHNSLHIILSRLFDYAGMFPPAARSFEAALQESSSFERTLTRPWMVASDIVLDTEHVHKLQGVNVGAYAARNPFRVCMLATEDPERVVEEATQLLGKEPPIVITSLEVKTLPGALAETLGHYEPFCASHGILLCIEPNLSGDTWREELAATITFLAQCPLHPALKCRLTGPTAITAERFAAASIAANDSGVPLKVTGGLHHPIVEPDRYPFPMGFLNVGVGVLLHRHLGRRVSPELLTEIFTNQDPKAFTFGSQLAYKDMSISIADLQESKARSHFTIGSCSLHEPDMDLSRLFPAA
ncbi:MAG: hypothetical protein RL518_1814 [Pseudomonadota bacterium]